MVKVSLLLTEIWLRSEHFSVTTTVPCYARKYDMMVGTSIQNLLQRNKLPQNSVALNKKHLLSVTVFVGKEFGSDVAGSGSLITSQ